MEVFVHFHRISCLCVFIGGCCSHAMTSDRCLNRCVQYLQCPIFQLISVVERYGFYVRVNSSGCMPLLCIFLQI